MPARLVRHAGKVESGQQRALQAGSFFLPDAQGLRQHAENPLTAAHRRQLDPPQPVREQTRGLRSGLQRQPCLADAAGTGQRDQARRDKNLAHSGDTVLPSDEGRFRSSPPKPSPAWSATGLIVPSPGHSPAARTRRSRADAGTSPFNHPICALLPRLLASVTRLAAPPPGASVQAADRTGQGAAESRGSPVAAHVW